jgi:hypothetical protein
MNYWFLNQIAFFDAIIHITNYLEVFLIFDQLTSNGEAVI